ncbi:MAG: TetR/AcrR family transcriptional regulator [Taibaiella sp.]|nr:TetR/AcrR family transcriptional regulator [Taibaiella sp.]
MEYNDKQQQIISTAEKLFASNGFDGTSVRDIATEAGVNLAMISYYFGSKEKLMQAVFAMRTEHMRLRFQTLLENKDLAPLQKVYLLVDDYIDKILEQQEFHKIMMREQMINKNSAIALMICETKKRNMELIKKLINEGQKAGQFKKNIDVMLLMTTLIGTTSQLVTTQHFYREVSNHQDMPDDEFQKHLKKKLSTHLKSLFKALLTYEN